MSHPYGEVSQEGDYRKRQGGKKSKPSSQKIESVVKIMY